MERVRWVSGVAVITSLVVSGGVLAGELGAKHRHGSASSPSELMMEQCMGAEGHKMAAEMMDRMHGEGAHGRMHRTMNHMMTMMGMMGAPMGRGAMGLGR